ncbi:TetR/AcrR family transcriptional regulator [Mycolicibacterium arseniciresistens]|uniref:TetR/AcrR family transcriptional regulator n=1 Tax=Mycolicibacterium arseniciresistens TaxID=3062257 RepID=A0ABT8UJJ1_9MYCO|nr:TetR/AcrR family transcriptional regulator [Mycolicibacterium arseniciresistens]MDO3637969.1 TetR/AcrR family transcriptional regulator [Mycolicibacterium arseniciresistens]
MTKLDRRIARTATAILGAAERLFLTKGFQATTVDELAAEADVALGSVYTHFGSKDGVYAALIDRALELDKQYCDEGFNFGTDPVGRLLGLAEGYLRFYREHPGYFRLFRFPPVDGPGFDASSAACRRIAERVDYETNRIAHALQEAMDNGMIRPLEPRSTARFVWAAWDGVIATHIGAGGSGLSDAEFDAVLDVAREILVAGLLITTNKENQP